jgi:hypothetical protein
VGDVDIEHAPESLRSRREQAESDQLIEQLRRLVRSAERPPLERSADVHEFVPIRTSTTVTRRVPALFVVGVIGIAALLGGYLVVSRVSRPLTHRGTAPAAIGTSSGTNLAPAAPEISVVRPQTGSTAASFAIRIVPASDAAASGVNHYEVWRRDGSENVPWKVVENIPAGVVSARGYLYTDTSERRGHTYVFRVVAVSATGRSPYHEFQTTPAR